MTNPSTPLVAREVLLPHLDKLRASGMSYRLIARRGRLAHSTIAELHKGMRRACSQDNARRILSVRPGHFDDIAERPALATIRRTQALYALGHHRETIRAACGDRITLTAISYLANGHVRVVDGRAADAIEAAYNRLGNRSGTCGKALARALHMGWAPPVCWDDDTIGDPGAVPQWTGHCGTDRGWWQHRANDIPVCPPCRQAHETWKAERKNLPNRERVSQLRLAQASAQTRGADLADEARRLFSHGYDLDQAAARLDVKKNTLSQELRRHPARDDMEAAA